jgi:SAM-dependent methyltransferase
MRVASARGQEEPREVPGLPEGTLHALQAVLHGARLLVVHRGTGSALSALDEAFRPSRLLGVELTADEALHRVAITEPAAAFDGVFLLGLLPLFADPSAELFEEVARVLRVGGLVVASTPRQPEMGSTIPEWALKKINDSLSITLELTRGRFELQELRSGVRGVGRMLIVARKK